MELLSMIDWGYDNMNNDNFTNETYQYRKIDSTQKFCKYCGNIIDVDCVVCPICGKQVETLKTDSSNVVINNINTIGSQAKHEPGISSKSRTLTLVLAILLGELGIHRFYSGKVGTGILYFCTCGLFFIGWIVDIVMILTGKYTDANGDYILLW